MYDIREGLGGQPPRSNNVEPLGLSLPELGELIRRAGRKSGFIVESEFKVKAKHGGHVRKIDWVWLSPETFKPVVAIEIEGQGVDPKSLANDILKFQECKALLQECKALLNVVALFQVDHDRTIKRRPPHKVAPKDWVFQHTKSFPLEIFLDEDFMISGGIENFRPVRVDF